MSRSGRSDMGCVRHSERGSCGEIILGYSKQTTTRPHSPAQHPPTHMPSIRGGSCPCIAAYARANDYPPDYKLTFKVQHFERRHLFQRWRERLGTSNTNLVTWPMHVSERWGWMVRAIESKK